METKDKKELNAVFQFKDMTKQLESATAKVVVLRNQLEMFIMTQSQLRLKCYPMMNATIEFRLSEPWKSYLGGEKITKRIVEDAIKEYQEICVLGE